MGKSGVHNRGDVSSSTLKKIIPNEHLTKGTVIAVEETDGEIQQTDVFWGEMRQRIKPRNCIVHT